jgi:two-component system chemotaxis response regulator CheB
MQRIRVLVVDDSVTVRSLLTQALECAPGVEVIAIAADGATALALCERLRPDVVTMDLTMPVMEGLEATRRIMARCPTPILVVASATRADENAVFDTLAAGAVDAIDKPALDDTAWAQRFSAAVRLVAGIPVVRRPAQPAAERGRSRLPVPKGPPRPPHVVALGASTGGPGAVAEVLSLLPRGARVTVLLCMHVGAAFAGLLVEWLSEHTGLPIRLARHGEVLAQAPEGTTVLLAPPGAHLVVRNGALLLDRALPERHGCKPSIDVLFESLARELGGAAIGCLLTGMGGDGAAGLRAMRDAGATTLVQDEATSAVFGMPAAAIALDAASWVLPLTDIGRAIANLVGTQLHGRTA